MKIQKHLPNTVRLGSDIVSFNYAGQPRSCHRCGSTAHFVADCPETKCGKCWELGHVAKDCNNQMKCSVCLEAGHSARTCHKSFASVVKPSSSWATQAKPAPGTSNAGPGVPKTKLVSSVDSESEESGQEDMLEEETTPHKLVGGPTAANPGSETKSPLKVVATDKARKSKGDEGKSDDKVEEEVAKSDDKISPPQVVKTPVRAVTPPSESPPKGEEGFWDLGSLPEDGANKMPEDEEEVEEMEIDKPTTTFKLALSASLAEELSKNLTSPGFTIGEGEHGPELTMNLDEPLIIDESDREENAPKRPHQSDPSDSDDSDTSGKNPKGKLTGKKVKKDSENTTKFGSQIDLFASSGETQSKEPPNSSKAKKSGLMAGAIKGAGNKGGGNKGAGNKGAGNKGGKTSNVKPR
ncbi:protein IWS1 homolog [Branchiostoma floridae]|uniref:Protein IWS1 homolog n=1 Tax=Branchiostoma floridae TaxID=7739 RepID=A0A9J7M1D9_BRAFL|nr:protein IWS1 homolog [Branchiostoma floridae]